MSSIFISYSHAAENRGGSRWKQRLLDHLSVFTQHGLIEAWDDEKIPGGWRWEREIELAIHRARLAVILLTNEALESEFIMERELAPLSRREAEDGLIVIPILCEPCAWKEHPWLHQVQIRPFEAKPLSTLTEGDCDRSLRRLATEIAEELSRVALAFARPETEKTPVRVYLDRFPLNTPGRAVIQLIGREQEIALLDLALAEPRIAALSLVAWGGVGKTVVTQHWLSRLQRANWYGARRVYAWSFYSQGTTEDRQISEDLFLAHALEWFGVKCDPATSPWDKGRLLADAVASERTLLILDGIEPLQYPPGPMGGQLRAPGVQTLLRRLATTDDGSAEGRLCVLTTREPVADIAEYERGPDGLWGRSVRVNLGNLTEDAGAALLHHAGARRAGAAEIPPDDAELRGASREVDGHALTLSLLGRFLHRAHQGDVRRRDLVEFRQADSTIQGGHTFRMLAAFEKWFAKGGVFGARRLAVLRLLGLFDAPADSGCFAVLRAVPVITGLTDPLFTPGVETATGQSSLQPLAEEEWNEVVSFLPDFGLLSHFTCTDSRGRVLDCHPLIREYFANQVATRTPDAGCLAHRRLYEHLRDSTEYQPDTLEGLEPLFQAVAHGCLANMHQQALDDVFYTRINRAQGFEWKKLGAFSATLSTVACFYERPWTAIAPNLAVDFRDSRGFLLNEAGLCLRALGRLDEAVEALRSGLDAAVELKDRLQGSRRASNLSELLLLLGETLDATGEAERSVSLADQIDDGLMRAIGRDNLGDALHQCGRFEDGLLSFRDAETIQSKLPRECPLLNSSRGFKYCDLLLHECERSAWRTMCGGGTRWWQFLRPMDSRRKSSVATEVENRAKQLLEWDERSRTTSLLDLALDHLTLGRAALYRAILDGAAVEPARQEVAASVDALQATGAQHHVPRGFLSRAWLHFLRGDAAGARDDLDEAWQIAQRGPMRLHMVEIHLYRARLFREVKPYPWGGDKQGQPRGPKGDLAAARALIEQCGYWRRKEELEDAEEAAKNWA